MGTNYFSTAANLYFFYEFQFSKVNNNAKFLYFKCIDNLIILNCGQDFLEVSFEIYPYMLVFKKKENNSAVNMK